MKKDVWIKARVTEEQRDEIRKMAEEKNMSISNLILNSIYKI